MSHSGETAHFNALHEVELIQSGRRRRATIEWVSSTGGVLLLKIEGVDSPEAGKALVGSDIVVTRSAAASLRRDEYYAADICGCSVGKDGRTFGIVRSVCDGGNGQLLEVEAAESGKTFLVPFLSVFVGEVDIRRRYIELIADWLME